MFYKFTALLIIALFYSFYFVKILIQGKQSINTNQLGKGNKPKKVLIIERITSVATVAVCVFEIISILMKQHTIKEPFIAGIIVGFLAVIIFAMATITMKNSWRVGIPEEKTSLVTNGIYSISRNPAFVGFDLLYISICMMFFNITLLIFSILAAVMLHLQILEEEKHMIKVFGSEYETYKLRTLRYLGTRK